MRSERLRGKQLQAQPINNPITGTARKIPISFKGYKSIIDNKGKEFVEFYAPAYDRSRYNLSLQTVAVELDENSNWVPVKDEEPIKYSKSSAAFEQQGVFYVSKAFLNGRGILTDYGDGEDKSLGYQFVLTPQDGGNAVFAQEAGSRTLDGKYNVISANNSLTPRSGTMYHTFLNSLNPSKEAKDAKATRTHFNDFGTTIQGVRDLLKSGIFDSYSYILSTPITGKMHGYWSENLFQVCPTVGSIEDFKGLQTDSFDRGISWINDGTFTSQGLKSPQFQHVLKWGKKSPYYNWFKLGGGKIELGILPAASFDSLSAKENDGRKHIKHTVINAPNKKDYDSAKPTYIQFYDDRLVDGVPVDIIENYPKFNTKDYYEIKTHQDSVVPYYFEINPGRTNMETLVNQEGTPLSDIKDVRKLFDFGEFVVVDKKDAKGMNNWDGNPEIVKMNLSNPSESIFGNTIGNAQVRNFLYQIASYWTGTCADALLEHNAKNLVQDKKGTLEAVASNYGVNLDGVVANIEDGSYVSQFLKSSEKQSSDEFLLRQISEYPLETIEFGQDLSSVLGSPYITMRPVLPKHQTLTRYDMIKEDYTFEDLYGDPVKVDKSYAAYMAEELPEEKAKIVRDFLPASEAMNLIYRNQIKDFVRSTLKEIDNFNKQNGKSGEENLIYKDSDKNELTPYGRYVAKILTPEIVKFAVVSALFGNDSIAVDDNTGAIKYNLEGLREKGIRDLGIEEKSPKKSAEVVVEKIATGMKANLEGTYYKNLASGFAKRLDGTNLKHFKTSEAIIQKTKSGLNWRFDAAKDVADLETRRNYATSFEKCWDDAIEFWGNFMKSVKTQNPASYSIAEVTDLWDFHEGAYKISNTAKDFEGNDFGKYKDSETATRMLLEKTGITTFTNYNYMFSPIVQLFSRDFEDGALKDNPMGTLKNSFGNFLKNLPLTAVNSAHNMMSNHDKLRPMHLLSLNVKLFVKNNPGNSDRDVVKSVVGENYKNDLLSSKAIAVGQAFNKYFDNNNDIAPDTKAYLKRAVTLLALGKTTESDSEEPDFPRADAFGTKDFSITLRDVVDKALEFAQAEGKELLYGKGSNVLNLKEDAGKEAFVDYACEEITKAGRTKLPKMWRMYIGLGGNPTLYNGDEYAQSGFESAAKNFHLGNREMVNHDVVKNPRRAGTAEYHKEMNMTSALHKRKELSALADGTSAICWNDDFFVFYKNNEKGSEVIMVNTDKHLDREWDSPVKDFSTIYLDKIKLRFAGGLTQDTIFKKLVYDKDSGTYINAKDKYYLNEGESPNPEYFGTEEEYVVKYNAGDRLYYLKRVMHDKEGYHHSEDIELDDNSVIFYKPQAANNSGTISFKGNPHVALANLKYNIPV